MSINSAFLHTASQAIILSLFYSLGVAYYDKVIDDLIANGIMPMVTLNHFDLPQALQDHGGWKSLDIADVFDSYAQFCFKTFGDRVKLWITLNEPFICATLGYENGLFAPGLKEPGTAVYLVGHNMLRAHARAWHSYNAHFRSLQGGKVSIALYSSWAEPLDPCRLEDVAASQRYIDFELGWFACPLFGTGDYPKSMRSRIEAQNLKLGFTEGQRLPKFSEDEPKPLGTADFFALNYYTSRKVKDVSSHPSELSFTGDQGVEAVIDPSWPMCGVSWLAVVPGGLRKLLKYIKVF